MADVFLEMGIPSSRGMFHNWPYLGGGGITFDFLVEQSLMFRCRKPMTLFVFILFIKHEGLDNIPQRIIKTSLWLEQPPS